MMLHDSFETEINRFGPCDCWLMQPSHALQPFSNRSNRLRCQNHPFAPWSDFEIAPGNLTSLWKDPPCYSWEKSLISSTGAMASRANLLRHHQRVHIMFYMFFGIHWIYPIEIVKKNSGTHYQRVLQWLSTWWPCQWPRKDFTQCILVAREATETPKPTRCESRSMFEVRKDNEILWKLFSNPMKTLWNPMKILWKPMKVIWKSMKS